MKLFGKIKIRTIFFALCVVFIVYLVFHNNIFEGLKQANDERISGNDVTATPGSKCRSGYDDCITSGDTKNCYAKYCS